MLTGLWKRPVSTCESIAISIEAELDTLHQLSESCCIYRVPEILHELYKNQYTPIAVSIGPFHHNNKRLQSMETHKLKYMQNFLHHSSSNLNAFLEIIKDKESRIRNSYSEPIPLSSADFIRMVLIDSIFIIELFRTRAILLPLSHEELVHDLRLLENQLPFFILKDLYTAAAFSPPTNATTPGFTELACNWLRLRPELAVADNDSRTGETVYCHLMDLLRSHHLPSQQTGDTTITEDGDQQQIDQRRIISPRATSHDLPSQQMGDTTQDGDQVIDPQNILCPTATRLYEAGVKFRATSSDPPKSLLDIHFDEDKGILTIPVLRREEPTESFFRNMTMFEQYQYPYQTKFSNYLFFLDCLINTTEDVQLLARAGIIENLIGSEQEVCDLINSLGTHISSIKSLYYYADTTNKLNRHYKEKWNRYIATFRHTYLRHPWAVISLICAGILLLLTLVQVAVGILAVPGVLKGS